MNPLVRNASVASHRSAVRRAADSRRRAAFTLIELLIVVAIIALLISILMPSLSRAKEQAKATYCRNNLRSIWTGIFTYGVEYRDRLPFMENANVLSAVAGTGPEADPFDPDFPTTIGVVLGGYVNPKSWVCPSAVRGYPASAGGGWKFTYMFGASEYFGGVGTIEPYDDLGAPPVSASYWPFDGRPMSHLDTRRYASTGLNQNDKGKWSVRFPVVADMYTVDTANHADPVYAYPHRAALDPRIDLELAREDFERNTGYGSGEGGMLELHADGDEVRVFLTRSWEQYRPTN